MSISELSSEDALRLNVLLANEPLAIRIHESSMTLCGLLRDGESSISLNPNRSDEKYLKLVRSVLSERALGNPQGYPLYLQRWTRMGRMRDDSLNALLKLGDPDAVFAVVCAEGLTDELAGRAWWASAEPENARRMLQTESVANGQTGKALARFLIEYLPFETETETMIESVRVAMRPGLLSEEERRKLWQRSARKLPYLVGFIAAAADDLPDTLPARTDFQQQRARLSELGGPLAGMLIKSLSSEGQLFLTTCQRILAKPPTQDVLTTTFDVIREYYAALRPAGDPDASIEELLASAAASADAGTMGALEAEARAMLVLSGLGYGVLRPQLKGSTASGGLMRRKLSSVLQVIGEQLERLLRCPDVTG